MQIVTLPLTFQWDHGNTNKNLDKHNVTNQECEEVFFDQDKKMLRDPLHSANEDRYVLIGHTKLSRALFIVFTVRQHTVRVISARDLNKKELKLLQ
ncbi:MAG: BrnT family toxin [Candidatus Kerfeldbacteria bacterium]|nr:BrnT family toxin [Candidatus Kerfeldbacteria bacterium]